MVDKYLCLFRILAWSKIKRLNLSSYCLCVSHVELGIFIIKIITIIWNLVFFIKRIKKPKRKNVLTTLMFVLQKGFRLSSFVVLLSCESICKNVFIKMNKLVSRYRWKCTINLHCLFLFQQMCIEKRDFLNN